MTRTAAGGAEALAAAALHVTSPALRARLEDHVDRLERRAAAEGEARPRAVVWTITDLGHGPVVAGDLVVPAVLAPGPSPDGPSPRSVHW